MIRTLVLADHAVGISGPHRNVVGTLNALSRRPDLEVRLLTGAIDPLEPYAQEEALQVITGFDPKSLWAMPGNVRRLWQAAADIDLIYVPTNLSSFLYAQIARHRHKIVVGPNVTPLPFPNGQNSPHALELSLMCDVWIEASKYRRDHVREVSGLDATIRHIHHAIDTNKFNPMHRRESIWQEMGLPSTTTKVLYVGNDRGHRKGVSHLLDTIKFILDGNLLPGVSFLFAGRLSESNLGRIRSLPNTHTLGFLNSKDLAVVQASSDIAVVPSSWENFPFSVLEAMASGLPVIAAPVGGIPEMVLDGETGLLVDIAATPTTFKSTATADLASAIVALALDPQRRKRFGSNARQRILDHFTEARLGRDLSELFHEVVSTDHRSGGKCDH